MQTLAVGMSLHRTASENGQSGAVGSCRRATGARAASERGAGGPARRCHFLLSSPEGCVFAAFARIRCCSVRLFASRAPGRASLVRRGAAGANSPSTANKPLKYVPALRASTGRAYARRLAKR